MAALMANNMCIIRLEINIFLQLLSDAGTSLMQASAIDIKICLNLNKTEIESTTLA